MMAAHSESVAVRLGDLLAWAGIAGAVGDAFEVSVGGLSLDSRRIAPGEVFVALAGSRAHGLAHASEAVARGAAAVLYDPSGLGAYPIDELSRQIPCVAVSDLSARLGVVADCYYGQPSRRLDVIGITGTNGKTSCSHYIAQALGDGKPCAVMGTQGWGMPGELSPTANTTPDALTIHSALASLLAKGVKALAMEVSSHGLHQGRVNGVRFKGAVFTNISHDHLDYHGDMDRYRAAKLKLLRVDGLEFVAANVDDASFDAVRQATPAGVRLLPYSATGRELADAPTLIAQNIRQDFSGIGFDAHWREESAPVRAPLFGGFNVDNVLAALAVLLGLGYGLRQAAARLAAVRAVPGRMERFAGLGNAPTVIVDYAHTPHALELVLQSLRGHVQGRLFCVFGCGGDRDPSKRSQMGRIASRWADQVIVTDDNPRHEDGATIVAQILAGCDADKVEVERDRRRAIAHAIDRAQRGDLVLIAGKGHETTQEIAGVRHPFSDRALVRELLAAERP